VVYESRLTYLPDEMSKNVTLEYVEAGRDERRPSGCKGYTGTGLGRATENDGETLLAPA
jgi:hypothetical protein